jgi:glycerol-3-phosphate cytidylyltransferase-like family protein
MTTAVTFGRYNIAHPGHVELVEVMLAHRDVAHVYISTARSNNCWDTRALLFRHLLRVEGVDLKRVKLLKAANPWEAVEKSSACGDCHPLLAFGEDQADLASTLADQFSTRFVLNKRTQSSTAVRHLFSQNKEGKVRSVYKNDSYSVRLVSLLRREEVQREKS